MQKYLPILLLIATLVSLVVYPEIAPTQAIITLLLTLALSIHTIYTKHKGTERARPKILKEAGVMVLTLVTIIFLGGLASMLANYYVSLSFGALVGLVTSIGASFGVGYLVRKGADRLLM